MFVSNCSPDFYLASSEGYDLEEPRRCFQIKRMRGDFRDDYLLVRIDPPINGQKYGFGGEIYAKSLSQLATKELHSSPLQSGQFSCTSLGL